MVKIFRPFESDDHETLIQEATKAVASVIRTNLNPTVANMNVSELRGYLRTRAAREAREQVRRLSSQVRLRDDCEAALTATVLERAVHLLIRDLQPSPIVAIPTPHVQSRAA